MDKHNQDIFDQNQAIFFNFQKRAGETLPPSSSISSPAIMRKFLIFGPIYEQHYQFNQT